MKVKIELTIDVGGTASANATSYFINQYGDDPYVQYGVLDKVEAVVLDILQAELVDSIDCQRWEIESSTVGES